MVFGCLRDEGFERYKCMQEDYSLKTYHSDNKEYITKDIDEDPFAPQRTRLKIREALDNIGDRFYQIKEKAAQLEANMRGKLINWQLSKLNLAAGEVWQQGTEEFIKETGVAIEIYGRAEGKGLEYQKIYIQLMPHTFE